MDSIRTISSHFLRKTYLLSVFFYCIGNLLYAQDQKLSDSLEIVYENGDFDEKDELKILQLLSASETNADKILRYSLQLIVAAKELDSPSYEFSGYLQRGNAYRLKSDLTKALESYFDAANIAAKAHLVSREAMINISIADVYSIMGDSNTSIKYYRKGLSLMEEENDSLSLASAQLNLGDEFYNQKKLDSALHYFNESGKIFSALNYEIGKAYNLGNLGLVYAEKAENEKAENNLNQAIEVLNELGDYYPICVYLLAMADVYQEKGKKDIALDYAFKSLELAKKHGLKEQISDSNLKLSAIHEEKGDISKAFDHFRSHVVYRDSLNSINEFQKMANVRTEYEVSQKQVEIDLLNQQKKTQRIIAIAIGVALFLIILLAIGLFKRSNYMKKVNKIIESEKKRSEDLLMNILPEETAQELKDKGSVKAKRYESVSVLFTDFKGFTSQSEALSPEALVESIAYYFAKFDDITEKYKLEKIKTIGDAYMCAGGLPFKVEHHTAKVCQAALEIAEFVRNTKRNLDHKLAKFDIRIGIHTGDVVAGVVGTKKFQYDIWGDTVNTASRMESAGQIGKVNVSEATYKVLKAYDIFKFEPRGALEAKGKGKIKMYFVSYAD